MMNKMGEIVHPVTIPFSTGCHFVVNLADWNRSLMSLRELVIMPWMLCGMW